LGPKNSEGYTLQLEGRECEKEKALSKTLSRDITYGITRCKKKHGAVPAKKTGEELKSSKKNQPENALAALLDTCA